MRKLVSTKLMVAILAAGSFVVSPVIAQAGEKDPQKKTEKMKEKDAKKAGHEADKADKKAHKEEMKKHKKDMKKHKKDKDY